MKTLKRFIMMAKPFWGTIVITVLALIGTSSVSLITPALVRKLTASLTAGTVTTKMIISFVIILVSSYILKAVFTFLSKWQAHVAAWNYVGNLTLTVYEKLQTLSMSYYSDKQTGQIMSRAINDTRNMETLIAHALPDMISNILIIVLVAIMLFTINPVLAAITIIPLPFVLLFSLKFSSKVFPLFKINQQVLGELNGVVQDNLSGMKEIQAFGKEEHEFQRMKDYCKHYSSVNIRANFAAAILHPSVEFLTSIGTVLVMGIGGALAMRSTLSTADVVGFFMYLSLFYTPLTTFARIVEDIQNSYAGGVRVLEILDMEADIKDSPNAEDIGRAKGNIEFKNVSFYYQQDEPVLHDISFKVRSGEMIAFVGATGVGKSTIVSLLERFYDPVSGEILLDSHNIDDITIKSLRDNISIVMQDVFLFNGSIYENIAYGNSSASREQVLEASKIANADCFINEMPQGYGTLIGERGVRLSGGQKQRIAIARAILKDSPILILDEATSAVDNETEALIQQSIDELSKSRTVIVIAHRLSTVMKADNIIVLEKGKITEQGRHEDLIKSDGLYSRLCKVNTNRLKTE